MVGVLLNLPAQVQQFIGKSRLVADKVGQSPSKVYRFNRHGEVFFLKVSSTLYAKTTYSVSREAQMIDWLGNKLRVPELVMAFKNEQFECMITRGICAKPISAVALSDVSFISLYQEVLQQLSSIPTQDCPYISDIQSRLTESKFFIDQGLLGEIDEDDFELELWGEHNSYLSLWNQLNTSRVDENLTFSHGDITDSNILLDQQDQIYFLDLGRAGLADQYVDIAFVERCLREDVSLKSAQLFLMQLQRDDYDKRKYFLQLDELN